MLFYLQLDTCPLTEACEVKARGECTSCPATFACLGELLNMWLNQTTYIPPLAGYIFGCILCVSVLSFRMFFYLSACIIMHLCGQYMLCRKQFGHSFDFVAPKI